MTKGPHALALHTAFAQDVLSVESRMRTLVANSGNGVVGPMAQQHLDSGGKRLRARLALAAAKAMGLKTPSIAQAWAAACELMHNATLVHDDVQDGDTHRRNVPTVWHRHGVAQAINVGDLLFMLPFLALGEAKIVAEVKAALMQDLATTLTRVIAGQAEECAWRQKSCPDPQTYQRMVIGKTAALFELPVLGAARLSGLDAKAAQACALAFAPCGALFQMQDDVLDLYGDKGRDVTGSDLYEGKMSALVVWHLQHAPNDSAWLLKILHAPREDTQAQDVQKVIACFVASGALKSVLQKMQSHAVEARKVCRPELLQVLEALLADVLGPLAPLMHECGLKGAA